MLVLASSLLILGISGHFSKGFPSRGKIGSVSREFIQIGQGSNIPAIGLDGKLCVSDGANFCLIHRSSANRKVLLVGDSHSADYDKAFREYAIRENINAWQFSTVGCSFLPSKFSIYNGNCGKARTQLDALLKNQQFSNVIFIQDIYNHENKLSARIFQEDMRSLQDLWVLMQRNGAIVSYFVPRYSLNFSPIKASLLGKASHVRVIKPSLRIENEFKKYSLPNVEFFNERNALLSLGCGQRICFKGLTTAGLPLYRDSNHLTSFAAEKVFQLFLDFNHFL